MDRDALLAYLQLAMVSGVGPLTLKGLLDRFGSAEAVLAAPSGELRGVDGVGTKLAKAILESRAHADQAAAELDRCAERGIELLMPAAKAYPHLLREIPDPPSVLYRLGEWQSCDNMAIGIVGSRHATQYGLRMARNLAGSLARAGLTIVSGLARGIDAAAHEGALEAGGRTIAVLGSGVLQIYPPEHADLARRVIAQGCLMSETPSEAVPHPGEFPRRNRVISGLSLGVIIVEATVNSGSLHTARHANEQGREVFAVPGRADSKLSRGCHALIRDGARLIETADDVLEELGPLVQPAKQPDGTLVHHPAELQLNELEQQVLQAINSEPTSIDLVVHQTGLPTPRVLSTISVLEMRRLVRRVSGNYVARP